MHLTEHDIDGNTRTIMGAESGTMARIEGRPRLRRQPRLAAGLLIHGVA